ncbi:RNA-binding S4 domain-containing protein [Devosia sp.]|uniref:RNA-binding S4 domain-containing protein n=1 Tax=Devosia sp. TaxID=1871048 RepID=UPI003A8D6EE3
MERQRLDKWLFFARAVKSRSLAQKLIETGVVRVNSERTQRTDHRVGPGDVLTMTVHTRLLVWRILDPGTRRGPASEAAGLYEDLSPPPVPRKTQPPAVAQREPGAGRPTKRDRRNIDRLRSLEDDGPALD